MKTVLVTGVDGFTGRYLAPLLAAAGHEVHGLVERRPAMPVTGAAHLHEADLTDATAVAEAVQAAAPQAVVHLAGIAFVANRDAKLMYGVNLLGTRNLLEALAALAQAPEAVLLASSANVYGNATEGALDETVAPAPANDYAVSKLAMEYVARLYATRLPLIVCRPFNYTGIGQSDSFLLPKIIAHVKREASHIELGNLDVARDFSDVRDVAAIYARLLGTSAAIGQTVNVCSGRAHTLREILDIVEKISGRRMRVSVDSELVRQNEVKVLHGNRARLDALLPEVAPAIPLVETLRWMIRAPST